MTPSFFIVQDKRTGLFFNGTVFAADFVGSAKRFTTAPETHGVWENAEVVPVIEATIVRGDSETPISIIGTQRVEWTYADSSLAEMVNTTEYLYCESKIETAVLAGKMEGTIKGAKCGAARGQRWEVRMLK